jgi:hypothetical protein
MPSEPHQVPVSPQPDAAKRRLHIHGINEMPVGYDAEVAELFRDLRAASALSETDLAARLGTRVDVVQALEQGALYALPPWAETCRVVNAYGALLNLDVRPLLRRIYAQLEAGIVELRPKAMPDVPVMTPPENSDFRFQPNKAAPPSGPSPLDIQWTPDPLPARPQNPPPPAPRAPSPQAPWPNAAPSPQAWPRPPSSPAPQAPWPDAAPQRPAAPQPQQPDRRAPPRPIQARPPQRLAQPPQRPAQPQQPAPPHRQPMQPQPAQPRAEFAPAPPAAPAAPVPASAPVEEKVRRKPALLKWGVIALLISIMAFGVWMVLGNSTGPSGAKSPGAGGSQVLDPDDPRSRKADRLPSPF